MTPATLQIDESTDAPSRALSAKFRAAFRDALGEVGDIDPRIYKVDGFCGRKFRLLLNNLIRKMNGSARYLEVGVYMGATLCPVLSDNTVEATAIDNWSWDKEKKVANTLYRNIADFKNSESRLTLIESDFKKVAGIFAHKFNVYFYDGDHSEQSQYDGIVWAIPHLEQTAIIMVDDWNWQKVRSGTLRALKDQNLRVDYMVELRTSLDDTLPTPAYGGSDWHNGFFGAVVIKS